MLIIPTAITLGISGSGNDLPEKMEWYFGIVEELSRMCTLAAPYTGNDHWPSLYCGAFTVFLVVMYVFNKRIKWYHKIPRVLLLAFFIVSFANNYLDYIWHGLRFPTSLPGRQAFLFIFLMLVVGFETYRKRKGNKIWHAIVATGIPAHFHQCSHDDPNHMMQESIACYIYPQFFCVVFQCYTSNKPNCGFFHLWIAAESGKIMLTQ